MTGFDLLLQDLIGRIAKSVADEIQHLPTTTAPPEKPLSIDEAANHLGVTRQTIHSWVKSNKIKSHVKGKRRYFLPSEIFERTPGKT
jgi:excisionase family DNA binding protein